MLFICSDKRRMLKALKFLIKNPQNNLKIFEDGNYVYGENFSEGDFFDVVQSIFQSFETSSEV